MSPSCTNRPLPRSMGFMGGTGSGVLLLPLETKLCAATSAVSLVACHSLRPSATACFCSGVHFRFLFASSEQVREQNRPRLVCFCWHCSQVFSLYAISDACIHTKHDFSAVFSTMTHHSYTFIAGIIHGFSLLHCLSTVAHPESISSNIIAYFI